MDKPKSEEFVKLLETIAGMNKKQIEIVSAFIQGMTAVTVVCSE